jgi:hypothetical protein
MSCNTSLDTLIKSRKLDNAIELGLIRLPQIGLNSIADGMQDQCPNRSDARGGRHEALGAEVPASDKNSAHALLIRAKKRAKSDEFITSEEQNRHACVHYNQNYLGMQTSCRRQQSKAE